MGGHPSRTARPTLVRTLVRRHEHATEQCACGHGGHEDPDAITGAKVAAAAAAAAARQEAFNRHGDQDRMAEIDRVLAQPLLRDLVAVVREYARATLAWDTPVWAIGAKDWAAVRLRAKGGRILRYVPGGDTRWSYVQFTTECSLSEGPREWAVRVHIDGDRRWNGRLPTAFFGFTGTGTKGRTRQPVRWDAEEPGELFVFRSLEWTALSEWPVSVEVSTYRRPLDAYHPHLHSDANPYILRSRERFGFEDFPDETRFSVAIWSQAAPVSVELLFPADYAHLLPVA